MKQGVFTNQGTISVTAGSLVDDATLQLAAGSKVTGTAPLQVGDNSVSGTLTAISGTPTIANLILTTSGSVADSGVPAVTIPAGGTALLEGMLTSGSLVNAGSAVVPDGKTFTINSQAVFTNNATMDLQGSATVTGYCGNPCGTVVNTGTIQKVTGAAAADIEARGLH